MSKELPEKENSMPELIVLGNLSEEFIQQERARIKIEFDLEYQKWLALAKTFLPKGGTAQTVSDGPKEL